MTLAPELMKALNDLNFTKPTDIQGAVVPLALKGKDVMACAETGSGKTAAYALPMIMRLLENPDKNGLILAPTRELVQQITDVLRKLTTHTKTCSVACLMGGADMRRQIQALKRKPRIIVATPGRLIDHLQRRTFQLSNAEILVLDEGDRMLDMGFAPQLNEILKYVPKKRQTLLFTATLPKKVSQLAETYLYQPEKISVGLTSRPVATIKQSIVKVGSREKDDKLVDELNERKGSVIVFLKTKRKTDLVARNLLSYGFEVELIHGGRTQGQRNRAIANFRNGRARILCATDVAARGIDIPEVAHVINFDLPMMTEDYVHRIGRTARNGATGEAVSFVSPEDYRSWQTLAKKYQIQGVEVPESSRGRSGPRKNVRFAKKRFSADTKDSERSFEDRPKRSSRGRSQERFFDGEPKRRSQARSTDGEPKRRSARSSDGEPKRRSQENFFDNEPKRRSQVRSSDGEATKRRSQTRSFDDSKEERRPSFQSKKKSFFRGKNQQNSRPHHGR